MFSCWEGSHSKRCETVPFFAEQRKERKEENTKRRTTNYHNKRKKPVWCLAGLWICLVFEDLFCGQHFVHFHCCCYVAYVSLTSLGTQDCRSCHHSRLFRDVILWISCLSEKRLQCWQGKKWHGRRCRHRERGERVRERERAIVMRSSTDGSWPKVQKSNIFNSIKFAQFSNFPQIWKL